MPSAFSFAQSYSNYYVPVQTRLAIVNPRPESNGGFGGRAVSGIGNTVVAGSMLTNFGNLQDNGVAYLFNSLDGKLLQTFAHPAPDRFNRFGADVADYRGNTLITTFPSDVFFSKVGELFLFDNDSGQMIHRFTRPSASAFDDFGIQIVALQNVIAVSAARDDVSAPNSGAVHLFDGDSGQYIRQIKSPSPFSGELFGNVIATTGDKILVGSTGGTKRSGDVFAFDTTTGSLVYKLENPFPENGDEFGSSIATFGNLVAVGARGKNEQSNGDGTVYFFDALTGNYINRLDPQFADNGTGFGSSLSFVGNRLVVGAYRTQTDHGFGVLRIYELPSRLLVNTILPPTEAGSLDIFGLDIHNICDELVIGYSFSGIGADDAGAVFFTSIPEPSSMGSLGIGLLCMAVAHRPKRDAANVKRWGVK